jgi:hypothetical protein
MSGDFLSRRGIRLGRTIEVGMRLFLNIVIHHFRMIAYCGIRRRSSGHEGRIQQRGVTSDAFGRL